MTGRPFFSVLIPSYNRPEFIGLAVASVLASDFEDFELIVSDDRSPRRDEIAAAIDEHRDDPRLRFHTQPSNLREPANREFLFKAARADWHVILSDDDLLYPTALRKLAESIDAHPDCGVFTFGYTVIDERGRRRFSRRAPKPVQIHRHAHQLLPEFLVCDAFPFWFYQPATFCAHRRVHEQIRPNRTIGIGDDTQYLLDYVNQGGIIHVIPEVLMCYRKMSAGAGNLQMNQSSQRLANPDTRYRMLLDLERRADVCEEFLAIVASPGFRERFVYRSIASEAGDPGQIAAAIHMEPVHTRELVEYYASRSRRWTFARGYLARCCFFVRLFGWAGILEILRVVAQKSCSAGLGGTRWGMPPPSLGRGTVGRS